MNELTESQVSELSSQFPDCTFKVLRPGVIEVFDKRGVLVTTVTTST